MREFFKVPKKVCGLVNSMVSSSRAAIQWDCKAYEERLCVFMGHGRYPRFCVRVIHAT